MSGSDLLHHKLPICLWKFVLISRLCWPFRLFASGWNLLWRPCRHKTQVGLSQRHINSWSTSTIHWQGKHCDATNMDCICCDNFINSKQRTFIDARNVQFIPVNLQQAVSHNWLLSIMADKRVLSDVSYASDIHSLHMQKYLCSAGHTIHFMEAVIIF